MRTPQIIVSQAMTVLGYAAPKGTLSLLELSFLLKPWSEPEKGVSQTFFSEKIAGGLLVSQTNNYLTF